MSEAQSIAAIIMAIAATGLGSFIIKGQVFVLTRELLREQKACSDLCEEKERRFTALEERLVAENAQLRQTLTASKEELKEQIDANTTLYREVLGTITWLQSLAGLAAADRRGGGDGPNARRPDTRSRS